MSTDLITAEDIVNAIPGTLQRDGKNYRCGCLICYGFNQAANGTGLSFRDGDHGTGVIFKQFVCENHTSENLLEFARKELKKGAPVQVSAKLKTNTKSPTIATCSGKEKNAVYRETARWIYNHADGTPDVRVRRFDCPGAKKKFLPGYKKGAIWVNKKKPGLQPLYRWDLIHASTRWLIIVEGEKACDAAAARFTDYDVTTWPGGSGTVLEADWERIAGRTVILWPDADQDFKSQKAMKKLAGRLLELGCSVNYVDPTGLPETHDLADPEPPGVSYAAMLETAKPYTEEELVVVPEDSPVKECLEIIASTTICQTDYPERRWIVRDILGEGLAMLAAAPKVGKTLFVTQLAVCVATGRDFLGYKTTRGSVLYIDIEADERGIKNRLRAQGWPNGAEGFYAFCPKRDWQLTPENIKVLERTIIEKLPDLQLIIIDMFERLIPHPEKAYGKNAYETGVARLAYLQEWVQEKQISMLLVHHTKKGVSSGEVYDAASGSRGITGTVETPITLTRDEGNRFILNVVTRYAPSVELLLERQGVLWTLLGDPALGKMTADQQAIYDYVQKHPGATPKVTARDTRLIESTVRKLMLRMAKKGILRTVSRGHYEINETTESTLKNNVTSVTLSLPTEQTKRQRDNSDRGTVNARGRQNTFPAPPPDDDPVCDVCGKSVLCPGAISDPTGQFDSLACWQTVNGAEVAQ